MSRKPPPLAPAVETIVSQPKENYATQIREYALLTPLFGGGVVPGEADPITLIRGASVRGHLRFWWRAIRGGMFGGDLARMKHYEDLLWGSSVSEEKRKKGIVGSRVAIVVYVAKGDEGKEEQPFNHRGRSTDDFWKRAAYGAFPAQPDVDKGKPPGLVRKDVRFTLKISFPQNLKVANHDWNTRAEVEAALWAWETFGGVGARTRRGFGALGLMSIDKQNTVFPPAKDAAIHLSQQLQKHLVGGKWPEGVPYVDWQRIKAARIFKDPQENNDEQAWVYLLEKLKSFRQRRNPGQDGNRFGRSKWPEPDQIRHLTGQSYSLHKHRLSHIESFPRAAFGLPIVFHFKTDDNPGDPDDTTVQGPSKECERLSSPVILRPLPCDNLESVALAAILGVRRTNPEELVPGGLILKGMMADGRDAAPITHQLSVDDVKTMPFLNGETDVLEAFLKTL